MPFSVFSTAASKKPPFTTNCRLAKSKSRIDPCVDPGENRVVCSQLFLGGASSSVKCLESLSLSLLSLSSDAAKYLFLVCLLPVSCVDFFPPIYLCISFFFPRRTLECRSNRSCNRNTEPPRSGFLCRTRRPSAATNAKISLRGSMLVPDYQQTNLQTGSRAIRK